MAIFFVGDYPRYYDLLSDPSQLRIASNNMSATCEALRTELQGVYALFSELSGDYSEELLNSFNGLQTVIESTMGTINNDLPVAVTAMEDLHDDLTEMKPKDEDYEEKKNTFDEYKTIPDKTTETEEGGRITNPQYVKYSKLKKDIKALVDELRELVISSDSEIDIINAFNDKVIEMRMRIASFEYATQNADFGDFASLSIEEKEAFIQNLISQMEGRFSQYKTAYENYSRFAEHMTDEQLEAFASILMALGIARDDSVINGADGEYTPFGWNFFNCDDDFCDPATRGLAMLDLLLVIDQNNILEKVDNYMVKGQSWQESGMEELYIDFYPGLGAMFESDKELYIAWIKEHGEDQFWNEVSMNSNFTRDDKAEIGQYFKEAVDIFRTDCEGFRENYMKAGNAAIAAQGLREMNKHIRYDELRNDPDYQSFTPTWDPDHNNGDADILQSLWYDCDSHVESDFYSWMNDEEHATLEYLYNKDPSLARDYIESMDSTVKQRKGYTDARNFYDSIHEGDNTGFDAALDHLRSFGKGGKTGVYKFGENISSLFDPTVDYSQNDYMHMSMISMLSSGDSYDRGLLIAYNLGEASGEAAIPLVVGLFNKTAGFALATGNTMGGDMKNTSIAMHQQGRNVEYEQLLAASSFKTFPAMFTKKLTGAMEGFGAPVSGKLFNDAVGATFKDSTLTIDALYGQDGTSRVMQYRMQNADQSSILHEEKSDGPTLASQYGSLLSSSIEGSVSSSASRQLNGLIVSGVTDLTGNEEFATAVGTAASPFTNAAGTATVKTTINTINSTSSALADTGDPVDTDQLPTFGEVFRDDLIGAGDKAGTKIFSAGQTAYTGITDAYEEFQTGGFHPGD